MMKRQRFTTLIVLLTGLLMLNGCGSAPTASTVPTDLTVTPEPIAQATTAPESTEEADIECDSAMQLFAFAFYDANVNGIYDGDDKPFDGIEIHIENTDSPWAIVDGTYRTDLGGMASTGYVFVPGCDFSMSIFPEVPRGYSLTTQGRYDGFEWMSSEDEAVKFGFIGPDPSASVPSMPVVDATPPTCTLVDSLPAAEGTYGITLAAAPDGSIWAGNVSVNGRIRVAHSDPERQTWTTYTKADGLPDGQLGFPRIAPNGDVWFSAQQGAVMFDGSIWTTYDVFHGETNKYVADIAISPDGRIWFTGQDGVASFNPLSDEWHFYQLIPDQNPVSFYPVVAMQDGSIWLGTYGFGVVHLQFPTGDVNQPSWTVYNAFSEPGSHPNYTQKQAPVSHLSEVTQAPDGMLWLLDPTASYPGQDPQLFSIVELNPHTETSVPLNPPIQVEQMWMHVAPDGSIWLSLAAGVYHVLPNHTDQEMAGRVLFRWQDMGLSAPSLNEMGSPESFWSMAFISDKLVWVGTDAGPAECIFP